MSGLNRRAARIIGAGTAAAVIALICWLTGVGETSRADFARQVSGSFSGSGSGGVKTYFPYSSTTETVVVDTYDKTSPPSTGCEAVVSDLQRRIIEAYSPLFEGIRHINMFGYLETENKGDAAIWTAQQILFSLFGIETMQACRFTDQNCDTETWRANLEKHKPHSAIVMAGGGNFNDFYWFDQPNRIAMVDMFHDFPIRMFPQSIHMRKADKIKLTKESFVQHKDLQLAGRDQQSFDWLEETFGPSEQNEGKETGVGRVLSPDIVFMFGNRPEFRNEPKTYDILIMARHDAEVSALSADALPEGDEGVFDFDGLKVSWRRLDWNDAPTPGGLGREKGHAQKAYLRAVEGFRILGRSEFVITDRLHGHIMSTVIGVPHVLLDSKLGKNLNLHETWTKDCDCTRIAETYDESIEFARLFFKKAYDEGRWAPGRAGAAQLD